MSVPLFVIILDQANDAEREAMQGIVKKHAEGWWHRFEDVWFVGGKTAAEWRDLAKPAIKAGPSAILVMRLPDKPRAWSYYGPQAKERLKWLKEQD